VKHANHLLTGISFELDLCSQFNKDNQLN